MSEQQVTSPSWGWVGETCGWCGCRAGAIPDEPPVHWEGAWYHRTGCLTVVRLKAAGKLPADYEPIEQWACR